MDASRPITHADIAVRFALENGLDPAKLAVGDTLPNRRDGYRLRPGPAGPSAEPLLRQLTALQIDAPRRWGNSVVQLSNAVEFAARHGISRVHAPGFWWISPPAPPGGADSADVAVVLEPAPTTAALLAGRFYHRLPLAPLYATPGTSIRAMRENLLQVRGQLRLLDPRPALPEDHLVIHIRSGDVFEGAGHPLYGQPPLAFYTLILKALPWRQITLVCEDRANPVVDALLAARLPGVPGIEYRPASLAEDLETLLGATSLVTSAGTFMPAVLALSARVRRVVCFERLWHGDALGRPTEVLLVTDVDGRYRRELLSRNWQNSAAQRELMLGYAERDLRLRRLAPLPVSAT